MGSTQCLPGTFYTNTFTILGSCKISEFDTDDADK